jgi:phosphoribosyl-ATP pyrophosphohydrolase
VKNFEELWLEIAEKIANQDPNSGSYRLSAAGVHEIGKKVLEEAGESWIAAEYQSNNELAIEISQTIYYLILLAQTRGLKIEEIYREF